MHLELADAIERFVHDGASVALEGFTHLIPFAAGHEIIRQRKRDLHLIRMTPDLIYDQMIGMGCARRLTFSWGGNPGVGSLHRLRDAVEHGWPRPLELNEHSHAGMAAAFTAGAARLLDAGDMFRIGARNYVVLQRVLEKNNIPLAAEDVGGTKPRTMYLKIGTGETIIRALGKEVLL